MRRLPLCAAAFAALACSSEPAQQASTRAGRILIDVPPSWTPGATSAMRVAEWSAPGEAGAATLSLFWFGEGGAGGVEANLERWRAQFEQQPPDNARVSTLRFPGRPPMTVLELQGTWVAETAPGSGQRHRQEGWKMIAAVLDVPGGAHYLKFVGPAATIDAWQPAFHEALASVRPAD